MSLKLYVHEPDVIETREEGAGEDGSRFSVSSIQIQTGRQEASRVRGHRLVASRSVKRRLDVNS